MNWLNSGQIHGSPGSKKLPAMSCEL